MDLNAADAFVIGLILLSTIMAIYRGLVREALTLVTWIIAGWLAVVLGKSAGQIFVISDSDTIKEILGMVTVFFAVVLVGMALKFLVFRAFSIGGPTRLDRFGGGLFGFARGMLVIMAVLWIAPKNTIKQPWYTESVLVPKVHIAADMVADAVPKSWKKDLNKDLDKELKAFGIQQPK
jgi:membrane protein required for colicin V production